MDKKQLIQLAVEIRKNAYAPYSKHQVGAVLVTKSGKVFTGVNVENCAYSSACAEKVAIYKAISEGEKEFSLLVVATASSDFSFPCGFCRQVIAEFCKDLEIIATNPSGKYQTKFFRELYPFPFSPAELHKGQE